MCSIQHLLKLGHILLTGGALDHEIIDDRPDAETTTGKEFADSHTGITDDKTIDSQRTGQYGNDQAGGGVLELHGLDDHPLTLVEIEQPIPDKGQLIALKELAVGHQEHIDFLGIHGVEIGLCDINNN